MPLVQIASYRVPEATVSSVGTDVDDLSVRNLHVARVAGTDASWDGVWLRNVTDPVVEGASGDIRNEPVIDDRS